MNIGNLVMTFILNSPLHFILSGGMLLLTYTGRRSEKRIRLPVSYQAQPDGSLIVTSIRSRSWWRSLRGGSPVLLRLKGKTVQATGIVLEENQAVADALKAYLAQNHRLARYFNIQLDANGNLVEEDLAQAARQRVVVRLTMGEGHAVQ